MERRVPDCTKARDLVGFEAVTRLDEIIGMIAAEISGDAAEDGQQTVAGADDALGHSVAGTVRSD